MTDQYSTPNVLQQHILLFGANYRAMFYVARKLYHSKYKIDVIDWENIPIEYSKYINKYYRIDGRDINKARTLLIDILAHQKYKTVIPINDVGILMCKMFVYPEVAPLSNGDAPSVSERKNTCDVLPVPKGSTRSQTQKSNPTHVFVGNCSVPGMEKRFP